MLAINNPKTAGVSRKIHFVGIGGIGVSALARYFLSKGWEVSGSDIASSSTLKELKKEGIKIFIQSNRSTLPPDARLVVYSPAINQKNPDILSAKKFKIPIQSYPEMIGELTRQHQTIAVAGTHGKSTTTALLALILIKAGLDPTVIVGTKLKELNNKNFRAGQSNWLILEADEYKASFLNYSPTLAVILNIDKDHLDFYKNFTNIKKAFRKFIGKIKPNGVLFLRETDNFILKASPARPQKIIYFSPQPASAVKIRKILQIPGEHNVLNALAAYNIARYLNIPEKKIFEALAAYRGAWRRMEYRGHFLKADVFDDYAHHPAEVKATLGGCRAKWPRKNIICVFQPHQAQRLKLLFNDFKKSFKDANQIIILPTYEVVGRENKTLSAKHTAEQLAKQIKAVYLKSPETNLKPALRSLLKKNKANLIIMMGAGDINNLTPLLISSPNKKKR